MSATQSEIAAYAFVNLHEKKLLPNLNSHIGQEDLLLMICKFYSQIPDLVKSKYRKTDVVWCRMVFMFLLKKLTDLGWKNIGCIFSLHHSTVIHAVKRVQDLMDSENKTREDMERLETMARTRFYLNKTNKK